MDAASLFARVSNVPLRVLSASRLDPHSSVADVAALPDGIIYSGDTEEIVNALVKARDLALEACGYSLDFLDGRNGVFKNHVPSKIGGAVPARGLTYSQSTRLTRLLTTTGEGLTSIEHVASGHEVSAWDLDFSFEWVFRESERVSKSIEFAHSRPGGCRAFSFADRCRASGHEELIPRISLDETLRQGASREALPPLKRIRLSQTASSRRGPSTCDVDPRARRHSMSLMMEASVRTQMASISKSWAGVRAGISSYARFMDGTLPHVSHFPVTIAGLRLWAVHFDNGDTLRTYISHLRFAHRVLNLPPIEAEDIVSSIVRGARRDTVRRSKPRVAGNHLDAIVRQAIREDDLKAARAYSVAYSFLFRCQSELFGIQSDGRDADVPYHSHIIFEEGSGRDPPSASVHLASRKNSQRGAVVSRPCICRRELPSLRCGHCALKAIVTSHLQRGGRPQDPLLTNLATSRATRTLRRRGSSLGIERCSWHAFRRGAASDIVRSGGTIGFLMNQGGWRSGAFLKYLLCSDVEDRRTLELTAVGLDSDSD